MLGVAVACVPVLLAVVGPLLEGRGPAPAVLAGAVVVTRGAALVQGLGRADGIGLAWAAVAFVCEAAFTLLAVPVLRPARPAGRLGAHHLAGGGDVRAARAGLRGPGAR